MSTLKLSLLLFLVTIYSCCKKDSPAPATSISKVKITTVILDSMVELNSPMNLYCTIAGGSAGYKSDEITWYSGNPLGTWAVTPNYSVSVNTMLTVNVYWAGINANMGTLQFNPADYTSGSNAHPQSVSLVWNPGPGETKITLHLVWD